MIKLGIKIPGKEFTEDDLLYEFDGYESLHKFMLDLNELHKIKGVTVLFEYYMLCDTDCNEVGD